MKTVSAIKTHADDPLAGRPTRPIEYKWLDERDKKAAGSAEIIRLVVDDQLGHCDPLGDAVNQRKSFLAIQEFIGRTSAVLVTDAGRIKSCIKPLAPTIESVKSGLASLETVLTQCELGDMEMLVGIDGCLCGGAVHLQSITHLYGKVQISLANTTVKVYPGPKEDGSLVGCARLRSVRRNTRGASHLAHEFTRPSVQYSSLSVTRRLFFQVGRIQPRATMLRSLSTTT